MKEQEKTIGKISKYMVKTGILLEIIICAIYFILKSLGEKTGGWENLRFEIITTMILYMGLSFIPLIIAGINGLRYTSKQTKGKLIACWILGIISFIASIVFIYLISNNVFKFTNTNILKKDLIIILTFSITVLPNILFLVGCIKEKTTHKKS